MPQPRSTRALCGLPGAAALLAALLAGCVQPANDTLEVGGSVPPPLRPRPMELGRAGDAPSVVSLDRSNWGDSSLDLGNDYVSHRPTYARNINTFEVSARASGQFPTLAEAITLPGGPSESEQIYDAVVWPIHIVPAALAVPLGIFFERPFQGVKESPSWAYDRRSQSVPTPAPTGDPLVDRLGLPALPAPEGGQ